jgi:hypothetical protein
VSADFDENVLQPPPSAPDAVDNNKPRAKNRGDTLLAFLRGRFLNPEEGQPRLTRTPDGTIVFTDQDGTVPADDKRFIRIVKSTFAAETFGVVSTATITNALEALAADLPAAPATEQPPEEPSGTRPRVRRIRSVPNGSAPQIVIGVDVQRMTDEAIATLATDPNLYQRGGALVGVLVMPDPGGKKVRRAQGSTIIKSLGVATLRERMSTAAAWLRLDSEGAQPALPPDNVVNAVHARGLWYDVRPLVSVATSPQLKPDGTILQVAGYDADTAILYLPKDDYIIIEDSIGIEDARGALAVLHDVVCDFPFAAPEHRAAWVAGVLTMLARPAIDGNVPLFVVDATTRGIGKGRLVDAATRLAHGYSTAKTSLPETDEEMRKRITSLLFDGDPAICLDNVTHAIKLPSLDAVLTTETWKDRALGTNERTITVPHRAVWWATGNNVSLGGDLTRRAMHIRMESLLENPEERSDFVHNPLLEWVDANRRKLVAAALTILRAYTLAGMPKQDVITWGSFESWSRLVPSALVWAGDVDPMLARATQDPALDEERRALSAFMEGLERLTSSPVTAYSMLQSLYGRDQAGPDGFDVLREVIEQETNSHPGRKPESRKLGKWLQRNRGRTVDNRRMERGQGAQNSATWIVKKAREDKPKENGNVEGQSTGQGDQTGNGGADGSGQPISQ